MWAWLAPCSSHVLGWVSPAVLSTNPLAPLYQVGSCYGFLLCILKDHLGMMRLKCLYLQASCSFSLLRGSRHILHITWTSGSRGNKTKQNKKHVPCTSRGTDSIRLSPNLGRTAGI